MSQTELHKLLYAALASGSAESHTESNAEETPRHISLELSTDATPQDIIAHYDIRARSQHSFDE